MAERSPRDPRDPLDEEAAWAEIVAGYGDQPSFAAGDGDGKDEPSGSDGKKDTEQDKAGDGTAGTSTVGDSTAGDSKTGDSEDAPARPGSFVVFAPGVGPRNWSAAEASDDDFDETDEGHFTPPEPPPLPEADVTTKFAWLAVIGGPMLLVAMVLLQQPVTWWITVLGIGGFLGGFATLVARMKKDDEDDDLPGSGAVV
ncbi:hypothetical protein [Streptomyces hygroscopicus]|uniref:hypothetical protein n=1 Tax=Streptomyces hygroscopicus TaxID=1912 RepID=UPI001FCC4979|nr:hypothetical protein [Streptomyces hygroscopicus]BDH10710.1 hypothetical protein HOK021_18890 [Streptomyces hygroscopicus]